MSTFFRKVTRTKENESPGGIKLFHATNASLMYVRDHFHLCLTCPLLPTSTRHCRLSCLPSPPFLFDAAINGLTAYDERKCSCRIGCKSEKSVLDSKCLLTRLQRQPFLVRMY
ncbi:hypothetical protein GDO78_000803 [Eleutherodactylus coqui]|uniref:Uncharacterized protein n=1 Tax=Eleutherodactylus coqui TaxID=57060 RepID=A0A8J6KI69_ELECQ|nr:hypothetical protein GDO78_000803 [Eleutherodactylus coqui]